MIVDIIGKKGSGNGDVKQKSAVFFPFVAVFRELTKDRLPNKLIIGSNVVTNND